MIASIISQYLESNRRLIIPQVGALLVKEPDHTIIFSSLFTRDDGVLRSLLISSDMCTSDIEASGVIDRLLFDLRFAVDNNEPFLLDGLGHFCSDGQGGVRFEQAVVKAPTRIEVEEPVESVEVQVEEVVAAPTMVQESEPIEPKVPRFSMEPDPDFKGLHYGGKKRGRNSKVKKRSVDLWMIIGIVAILAAAGVILYGFLRDGADQSGQLSLLEQYL